MFHGETTDKKSIGRLGEDLATDYLLGLGHKILGRNIGEKFGEIDVLTKDKKGTLHFVEVKTISTGYADYSGMEPEDNLSRAKLIKVKRMADWYMGAHPKLTGDYQIDLIAIKAKGIDLTGIKNNCEIKLYTNLI